MGDGVTTVSGPFTVEARQEILSRLLAVQKQVGMCLIGDDEIARIRTFWAEDAIEEARRHLKQTAQLRAKELA
jgi:DNA sulfur modification protein DndC